MTIYWRRDDIPALQGLSSDQKKAAVQSVTLQVWRHWQVWLPFVLLVVGYAAFWALAPMFPYRFLVITGSAFVLSRVAALPFHSYLQHYLSRTSDQASICGPNR